MSINPEDIRVGESVRFAHPDNGWPSDKDHAKQHLVVGEIYEVTDYEVYESSSRIWLDGFEKSFNSVHFEAV